MDFYTIRYLAVIINNLCAYYVYCVQNTSEEVLDTSVGRIIIEHK